MLENSLMSIHHAIPSASAFVWRAGFRVCAAWQMSSSNETYRLSLPCVCGCSCMLHARGRWPCTLWHTVAHLTWAHTLLSAVVSCSSAWCCFSALVDACLLWLMTPESSSLAIHSGFVSLEHARVAGDTEHRRALIGMYHLQYVKAAAHSMYDCGTMRGVYCFVCVHQ
jgi:hypothetical protein